MLKCPTSCPRVSAVLPFCSDPVLNMTTRIDVEKAGWKLPNPVFESLPYLNSSTGSLIMVRLQAWQLFTYDFNVFQ